MKHRSQKMLGLAIAMLLTLGNIAAAQVAADDTSHTLKEIKITLDQTPAPVKAVFEKESVGYKTTAMIKVGEGAKAVYWADQSKGTEVSRITVDEKGTFKGRVILIPLNKTPRPVHAAVRTTAKGGFVDLPVERSMVDGEPIYTVIAKFLKEKHSFYVASDGKVTARKLIDPKEEASFSKEALDKTPDAVKAVLQKAATGARLNSIRKGTQGGKTIYTAQVTAGRTHTRLAVAEDGNVLEKAQLVSLKQVPQSIQESLKRETPDGRVGGEVRKTLDEKPTYIFTVKDVKSPLKLTITADGKVIKREEVVALAEE